MIVCVLIVVFLVIVFLRRERGNCISLYNWDSIITVGEVHGFQNYSPRATTGYYFDGGERD